MAKTKGSGVWRVLRENPWLWRINCEWGVGDNIPIVDLTREEFETMARYNFEIWVYVANGEQGKKRRERVRMCPSEEGLRVIDVLSVAHSYLKLREDEEIERVALVRVLAVPLSEPRVEIIVYRPKGFGFREALTR